MKTKNGKWVVQQITRKHDHVVTIVTLKNKIILILMSF
jgi:hypothetical protein